MAPNIVPRSLPRVDPLEREIIRQFLETRWICSAFFATQTVLCMTYLKVFGARVQGLINPAYACCAGQAAAREFVHATISDPQRAHRVFSWAWCCVTVVTWGAFGVGQLDTTSSLRACPQSDCPEVTYVVGCFMWLLYGFYQCHVAVAALPRAICHTVVLLAFSVGPSHTPYGEPVESLLVLASLLLAELLGYTAQAHRHQAQATLEQLNHRVINHLAKRCMTNTAKGCQLILHSSAKLSSQHEKILRQMRADSIAGFHMCNAMLLEASLRRGAYESSGETFDVPTLFSELGLDEDDQFRISTSSHVVRTDKALLQLILFNGAQNARTHGQVGSAVAVRAWVDEEVGKFGQCLHVTIESRRGANHERLLALRTDDLFAVGARELKRRAVGRKGESTYLGLGDMQLAASMFTPPAALSLRVLAYGVRLELSCRVQVLAVGGAPHSPMLPTSRPPDAKSSPLAPRRAASSSMVLPASEGEAQQPGQQNSYLRCDSFGELSEGAVSRKPDAMASPDSFSSVAPLPFTRSPDSFTPFAPGGEGGSAPAQAPSAMDAAIRDHPAAFALPEGLPPGLVYVIVDDDLIPRIHAEAILKCTQADEDHSAILGESYDEVAELPARLRQLGEARGPTNVVTIIDQNMSWDEGTVLGTTLCRTLRDQQWEGALLLHTANDEPDSIETYLEAGADGCIGKGAKGGMRNFLAKVAAAYRLRADLSGRDASSGLGGRVEMVSDE